MPHLQLLHKEDQALSNGSKGSLVQTSVIGMDITSRPKKKKKYIFNLSNRKTLPVR
jgi:hypothetical protein